MGQIQTKNFIPHSLPLTASKMSEMRVNDVVQPTEDQIVALNLQLLNHELPDAGQDFVDQNFGRPLETFKCFNELPTELRLIMWDFMLPRRRVVDFRLLWGGQYGDRFQPPLSVCLSVNHESRRHFLKHYSLFFQRPYCERKRETSIICLDPKLDLVRIDADGLFVDHTQEFFELLFGQNPECLAKVSSVEIVNVRWNHLQEDCEMAIEEMDLEDEWNPIRLFRFFTGLKTIHLTEVQYGDSSWRDGYCKDAYNALVKLAEHDQPLESELSGGDLPTIIMHEFRRNKVRSDFDYLFDRAMFYPWHTGLPEILRPQLSQTSGA